MFKFLVPFLFLSLNVSAQNKKVIKVAEETSLFELKKNLYFLASNEMQGRMTASKEDTLASIFIRDHFKKHGLEAPYENGNYFQPVPLLRKTLKEASLSIGNKTYQNLSGWYFSIAGNNLTDLKDLPVVFAGYGIEDERYNDFSNIDVKGKVLILVNGQPRSADGKYVLTGTERAATLQIQRTLKEKGAVAVLLYTPAGRFNTDTARLLKPALSPGFTTSRITTSTNVPVLSLSEEKINELLAPANTTIKALQEQMTKTLQPQSIAVNNTVSINLNIEARKEVAPNVIGIINGTDPAAGAVILSAHHDHDGKIGNVIYPGAVDNASGTVAIMEVARLMKEAGKKGERPKRTIIFASFTGEEIGLVGSSYLAEHPVFPLDKTHAILNIDMMGRVDTFYSGRRADSMYAYILVQDTLNRGLRKALFDAHEATGKELKLDPYYEQPQFMQRRLAGSDQYPFFLKGVPFIRIDCGFSKDYHRPTDTPDKINYELLQKQVRLTFLTVWNLAND